MAETSRRWSPYVYGNDNPLRFIDPDGRETTAYGGFTSFAEMAARHEAAAEANTKPRDDEGCPPHCPDAPMAADATRTTDKVTPQIADGSVQLPNFEEAKLSNGDSKLLPHEKAGVDGVVLGLQMAGSEIALAKALRGTSIAVGAAKTSTQKVNRIYSARELIRRAAEPGPFHNFPESFNKVIFQNGIKVVTPNYFNAAKSGLSNTNILYNHPGEINGVKGFYEIGVRPSLSGGTEVIMDRFFNPLK